jgi:hypothetical protein
MVIRRNNSRWICLKQYLLPYNTSLKNHNSNKSIDNSGGPRLIKIEGQIEKKNLRG